MRSVAIITARGGSKRIPDKNIRDFRGKPIICYSIDAAVQSGLFDEVMVSTDSENIAAIALASGAKVPFLRSEKNSDDHSTTADVLVEVLDRYRANNIVFDYGCCIYPTAPFVTPVLLNAAHKVLVEDAFEVVFPVVEFSYPIYRALERVGDKVKLKWPENEKARSQDLPKAFHDAGQFYWFKCATVLRTKSLFTEYTGSIIVDEMQVQDIDTEKDWQLAELKYSLLFNE